MANKGFGTVQDPKKNGRKGGLNKGKSTKVQVLKQLRAIKDLPYEEYLAKLQELDPAIEEPTFLDQIFLAGEKGYEYLMTKELKLINENIARAMAETNDKKERAMLAKERYYLWKTNKDSFYGAKSRSEVKLSGTSKLQLALEDVLKDDD